MNSNEKYQVKLNEANFQFDLLRETVEELDISRIDDRHFHLLKDGQAFKAEVVETDFARKRLQLKINGKVFDLEIADHYDLLVEKMGLDVRAANQVKDITAPMPGMVLNIAVRVGQNVQQGDGLVILEAMKMENIIKAQGEGVVKEIHVETGTAVDKGQLLVKME